MTSIPRRPGNGRALVPAAALARAAIVAATAALVLASCPPAPGAACKNDAQCDQRSICYGSVCRMSCNSSQECSGDEVCAQGVCLPPDLAPTRDAAAALDGAISDGRAQDRARADALRSDGASDAASDDRPAGDGSGSDRAQPDAAPTDANATDTLVCQPAYQDPDGDCQVRSSQVVVCNPGGLPAGWCAQPLLQQQGPRTASVEGNVSTGATDDWSNLGHTGLSDNLYTRCDFRDREGTAELQLTGFGFALPAAAIVVGIAVTVERSTDATNGTITDSAVQLVRAGAAIGTNHASTDPWPTSDATITYGHLADSWGLALTGADVDDPSFGLSLRITLAGGGHSTLANLDLVQMTISFHDDCDDRDAQRSLARYLDADGDGYGVDPLLCVGSEVGHTLVPGDCDDNDSNTWRHRYRDVDLDGHGAGALLCTGAGTGFADVGDDCDDGDNRAYPGQTAYFAAARPAGSFDFDCDGAATQQNACNTGASTSACTAAGYTNVLEGWVGTIPGCGQSGTYRGCVGSTASTCPLADFDGLHSCAARSCIYVYSRVADVTATQACR